MCIQLINTCTNGTQCLFPQANGKGQEEADLAPGSFNPCVKGLLDVLSGEKHDPFCDTSKIKYKKKRLGACELCSNCKVHALPQSTDPIWESSRGECTRSERFRNRERLLTVRQESKLQSAVQAEHRRELELKMWFILRALHQSINNPDPDIAAAAGTPIIDASGNIMTFPFLRMADEDDANNAFNADEGPTAYYATNLNSDPINRELTPEKVPSDKSILAGRNVVHRTNSFRERLRQDKEDYGPFFPAYSEDYVFVIHRLDRAEPDSTT